VKARDGRKGGNVLDFVAVMEGCTIRDAALKLQNWFSVEASNERPADYVPSRDRKKQDSKKLVRGKKDEPTDDGLDTLTEAEIAELEDDAQEPNQPLEFELKSIEPTHPYIIRRRGIKAETAEHFGIGFFYGKGSMAGRVVFPVHDEAGILIGYAGRAVDDELVEKEGKYKTPFRKSLVVFNLHRVLEAGNKNREVVVVEGFVRRVSGE